MGLGDKVVNKVLGTNIKSIAVSPEILADMIEKTFIVPAQSRQELDQLEKTISGSWFMYTMQYSNDERFLLYVSHFQRGLVTHRTVWIKNIETEEIFERRGYTLAPIKKVVAQKIIRKRMEGFEQQKKENTVIVESKEEKVEERETQKVTLIRCPYCAELIKSNDKVCPICSSQLLQ